jgi:hypothetical protein
MIEKQDVTGFNNKRNFPPFLLAYSVLRLSASPSFYRAFFAPCARVRFLAPPKASGTKSIKNRLARATPPGTVAPSVRANSRQRMRAACAKAL